MSDHKMSVSEAEAVSVFIRGKQEYLYLVDSVVRKLGKEEASVASRNRQPKVTLKHFI